VARTDPNDMSRRTILFIVVSVSLAACSHAPPHMATVVQQGAPSPRLDPGYAINAAELRRDLFVFADDSFRGRETGTPEALHAAAFLARRVQQLGLEPAGDSLYMQRVPLVRERFAPTTQLLVTHANGREQSLRLGADVTPAISLGPDSPPVSRSADGEIVFVGNGPSTDSEAAALTALNLEGKVVVTMVDVPARASAEQKHAADEAMTYRTVRLMALHPSAIVYLMMGTKEDDYQRELPTLLRNVVLDGAEVPDTGQHLPMLLMGPARRGSPLLPARWPNDTRAQPLGRQFSGHVEIDRVPFTGYNVVAVVRGMDPRFNKSYLAYGAHYDHIGIVPSMSSSHRRMADTIANGADDDGSGSIALLAIAQQMMIFRPRRSVLFVWHVGEEKGLLGSAYFTAHPTVPIDSIVTEFNADMIGRNEANTVALIGPRAAPNYLSWRVGMIVDSVNRAFPMPLHIDRTQDDPDDPDRIYQRSDHYNYAKKGIPVIFFTTGMHEDYHRVTDEASKIDYDKLARISRLMLEAGLAVANRSTRPTSEVVTQSISSRQH
jgi:peptidase M28-like protein